jgi:hypothetical protein
MPRANRHFSSDVTHDVHSPPLKLRFLPDHVSQFAVARIDLTAKMIF